MGLRFRKKIKLLPGLSLNLSKSGISTSVGGKGATVNISSNGVRSTIGVPGTGISYSTLHSKNNKTTASQSISTNHETTQSHSVAKPEWNGEGNRPITLGLTIGLVLMPYIFAWFLLKQGYSNTARVVSFGWAAIFLLSLIF